MEIKMLNFFFLYTCHEPYLVSHETSSSSAECSRDKPPFSFVRGQDLTMWDIVWVSPQGHRSVSVSRHFLLQAPQCPCSVQKRFSRDHCCRGRSKPGCRTTWADFQLCLHRLLISTGCKSSHNVELNKRIKTIAAAQEEAGRLMFNDGVIPKVLLMQQTIIANNRYQRSHSDDNICRSTSADAKSNRRLC